MSEKQVSVDQLLFEEEAGQEENEKYLKMADKTNKQSNPALYALQQRLRKEHAEKKD